MNRKFTTDKNNPDGRTILFSAADTEMPHKSKDDTYFFLLYRTGISAN